MWYIILGSEILLAVISTLSAMGSTYVYSLSEYLKDILLKIVILNIFLLATLFAGYLVYKGINSFV